MEILYKQKDADSKSSLYYSGIQNCYLKRLLLNKNTKSITLKPHHHMFYEAHIVVDGFQEYHIQNKTFKVQAGEFLLIPPNIQHTILGQEQNAEKYSLTFALQNEQHFAVFKDRVPSRALENIAFIVAEFSQKKETSVLLIENSILEIIIYLLRISGMKESFIGGSDQDHSILRLAQQYIKDNIKSPPSVYEVSEYCHLSTRQLSRVFKQYSNTSPGKYIQKLRIETIQTLLANSDLSLEQISEIVGFQSEFYFNSYFKTYAGIPPGAYRKMAKSEKNI